MMRGFLTAAYSIGSHYRLQIYNTQLTSFIEAIPCLIINCQTHNCITAPHRDYQVNQLSLRLAISRPFFKIRSFRIFSSLFNIAMCRFCISIVVPNMF